jgi:hypothetical protein
MVGSIPRRAGLEVFINEGNTISLKQDDWPDEDVVIAVHPDDVPRLISLLQEARAQIENGEEPSDPVDPTAPLRAV